MGSLSPSPDFAMVEFYGFEKSSKLVSLVLGFLQNEINEIPSCLTSKDYHDIL